MHILLLVAPLALHVGRAPSRIASPRRVNAARCAAQDSYDLLIIGGGSAGLTAAKFAATFGFSAAIVEKARLGGDCTWTGCVPSKALLAAAEVAHTARTASEYGISTGAVTVDFKAVRARIDRTIQTIYTADDSPAALAALGVDSILGAATFVDAGTLSIVQEGGEARTVAASKGIVVASGAVPVQPKIHGLEGVPYITYEDVFSLEELPRELTVVGGGPIGCELAQAFARLGSKVTLVSSKLLPSLDAAAGDALGAALADEGVTVVRGRASAASKTAGGHSLECGLVAGGTETVTGDVLLVATGRRPLTSGLGLEVVGIELNDKGGIKVDGQLRTSCARVYAAGDCTGDQQFTHYAGFQGGVAARNLLLPLSSQGVSSRVPGSTFTAPEVAHIGLTMAEATESFGEAGVRLLREPLSEVDRAVCAGTERYGYLQIVCSAKDGAILGATIVAPSAGEIIAEIAVAMDRGVKFPELTLVMHAYPTYSLALQVMASKLYYENLQKSKRLYAILKRLGL